MKTAVVKFAGVVLGSLLLSTVVLAADKVDVKGKPKADDQETTTVESDVTVRAISGRRDSAKFEEYRSIRPVAGNLDVSHRKSDTFYLDLKATDIALEDQRYGLQTGQYGHWKLDLTYDETPHRFAYGATTAYVGVGTGSLHLDPYLNTYWNSGANTTAAKVNTWNAASSAYDLELFRKKIKADLSVNLGQADTVNAVFSHEKRDGTRPMGFGNFASEIVEPIDYRTNDGKVQFEHARDNWFVSGAYAFSDFDNRVDTLLVDYLGLAVSPANRYNGLNRIDLCPSNQAHTFSLTGSVAKLPWDGRLTLNASWGRMEQNDPLVPYTANTLAVNADVANASIAGRTANSKVDNENIDLTLTARPVKKMRVKARLNHYDYDNRSPEQRFDYFVANDTTYSAGSPNATVGASLNFSRPFSFRKTVAGLDLAYDLARKTVATLAYAHTKSHRTFREVLEQDENSYSLAVDSHASEKWDLHGSYAYSTRSAAYDGFTWADLGSFGNNPLHRRFDVSKRDRNSVKLVATGYISDKVTVSGSATLTNDDYPDTFFGVLDDETHSLGLDVDWQATSKVSVNGFYNTDRIETNSRGREWANTGVGSMWGANTILELPTNWTVQDTTDVDTFGGSVKVLIDPKKNDFALSYSNARSNGYLGFASAVGTAANDLNRFNPFPFDSVDDTRLQTLDAKYSHKLNEHATLSVGNVWERLDIYDYALNGVTTVPVNGTTFAPQAALMVTLPRGYNANVTYANVKWRF